jgi:hypothetical protein
MSSDISLPRLATSDFLYAHTQTNEASDRHTAQTSGNSRATASAPDTRTHPTRSGGEREPNTQKLEEKKDPKRASGCKGQSVQVGDDIEIER